MKKINWKIRFKNPVFYWQIGLAIIVPILSYAGLTASDITTWGKLGGLLIGALSNPYILVTVAVSVFNAINDPTTSGVTDSKRALSYTKVKKEV